MKLIKVVILGGFVVSTASKALERQMHGDNVLQKALELAAVWHDGTYRKSVHGKPAFIPPADHQIKMPVITHLVGVGLLLLKAGWDDQTVAAGFLHDCLEDPNKYGQSFSYEQLQDSMGSQIADLVKGVSEQKIDEHGIKLDWKTRKVRYIDHLRQSSAQVLAISLADKVNNLTTMNLTLAEGSDIFTSAKDREALSAGPADQVWYFSSVIEISKISHDPRLLPLRTELEKQLNIFKHLVGVEVSNNR